MIVSFEDAQRIVQEQASAQRAAGVPEAVELRRADCRVLAETVEADRDQPPFPRAARDGFAVRAADVASVPARLKVVGTVAAGAAYDHAVQNGECVEIMTGAPVPEGADAVVMVEYSRRDGDAVVLERGAAAGENVVPRGAEAKQGQTLLEPGALLNPARIGLLASVGRTRVNVFPRPRVAILSTGDEVVDISAEPGPSQIRNSNSHSLAAQVAAAGGEPVLLPIAPDEREPLRRLLSEGLAADMLLVTGGVSMGQRDLVEPVLAEFGAEFFFTGAQIQPGRPLVFGRARRKPDTQPRYFFGLPGNPVSTMVCFHLFARTMLRALAGVKPEPIRFLHARLKSDVRTKTGLTRFLPAILTGEFASTEVELAKWQGSGDLAATARANCLLVIPPDREKLSAGDWVAVVLLTQAT